MQSTTMRASAAGVTTGGTAPRRGPWLTGIVFALALDVWIGTGAAAQQADAALDEKSGAWELVQQTGYGEIFLDTARVVALDADVYQVRTLWHFARAQHEKSGGEFRSSVAVRAIDCRARAMAILAFANQDGPLVVGGAVIPAESAEWEAIAPASVVARVAERACSFGREAPRVAGSTPTRE